MTRLNVKRWRWRVAGVLAVVGLLVVGLCGHYRLWGYHDYRTYQEVCEFPIGEELWFGRIKGGQDLQAFTARHPPHHTDRMGRFTIMTYYSVWPLPAESLPMASLTVIAQDERLVQALAAGCTWQRHFFSMPADSAADFEAAGARHAR